MANNIATVSIPASVVQLNNHQFVVDGQPAPQTINIPCRNAEADHVEYYFVPIKDSGVMTIYEPVPIINSQPTKDITPDSFRVFRVRDKLSPFYNYWVIGQLSDYYASCAVCCGESAIPMPCTEGASPENCPPPVVPCQSVCDAQNDAGNYYVTFAAPVLGAGEEYLVNGEYNNEALDEFTSTSLDDLVTDLNSNYGTVGSPAVNIVWTRNGTTIIGTFQSGLGVDDEFCLLIQNVAT